MLMIFAEFKLCLNPSVRHRTRYYVVFFSHTMYEAAIARDFPVDNYSFCQQTCHDENRRELVLIAKAKVDDDVQGGTPEGRASPSRNVRSADSKRIIFALRETLITIICYLVTFSDGTTIVRRAVFGRFAWAENRNRSRRRTVRTMLICIRINRFWNFYLRVQERHRWKTSNVYQL